MSYFREVLRDSTGFNGSGTATYPNGDSYNGEFQAGVSLIIYNGLQVRHGSGVYTYASKADSEGNL